MKNLKTFDEFLNESIQPINEVKAGFTSVSKADSIISSVDAAIKGGLFYEARLGDKIYMREGGKRPVAAEKFRKTIWLTMNNLIHGDGVNLKFEYDHIIFTVPIKLVAKKTEKEYLEYRLEQLFNQMHSNSGSDWDRSSDAQAAGVSTSTPTGNVSPYIDCGFIQFFADKYKIDLKKFMHEQGYTLSYDTFKKYAEEYPYKK